MKGRSSFAVYTHSELWWVQGRLAVDGWAILWGVKESASHMVAIDKSVVKKEEQSFNIKKKDHEVLQS